MPLISIIIPVYNAERYLSKCIESILAQSVRDFELLLVNDGSKDSSLAICRDYEQRDCRVRVLDKPNGGVSSARNMGLDEAQGEWVMFVDADDWLTDDALAQCVSYIPNFDIIRFSYREVSRRGVRDVPIRAVTSAKQYLGQMVARTSRSAVWGSIYRKALFVENSITFDEHISFSEDWYVSLQLALSCKSVKTLPEAFCYEYNLLNDDSCTNNLTPRKMLFQLEVLKLMSSRLASLRGVCRNTRCTIVYELLRIFSPEELCEAIIEVRDCIDFITWWDVLCSNLRFKNKRIVWRFLRYCRGQGIRGR